MFVLEIQYDVTEEISLSTLNLSVFMGICKIGKLHLTWNGIEVHLKWGKAFELLN